MSNQKILLVDRDQDLLEILKLRFERLGFRTISANDSIKGLALFKQEHPELVIMGLAFSTVDGLTICKQIRSYQAPYNNVPILMISIYGDLAHKKEAFEAGVDDYLTKPFQIEELIYRSKSLMRRSIKAAASSAEIDPDLENSSEILHAGDITLMPESREAKFKGHVIHFTPIEFEILYCLMQNIGKTVPPNQLISEIWGHSPHDDIETIRVHIRHLRQRLDESLYNKGTNDTQRKYIRTIYGKGYQLIPEGFSN